MPVLLKHVGRLRSTDSKCVIVMMQIPGNDDHALIVESDSLPDRMHQAVMEAVESTEGQAEEVFARVLGRKLLPDSGGIDIMNALHTSNRLRSVSVDEILMVPAPNRAYPLRQILESQGKLGTQIENVAENAVDDKNDPNLAKFNPHIHNQRTAESESNLGVAKGIMVQADLLAQEANRLYAKAYDLAPSLRNLADFSKAPTPKTTKRATKATKAKTVTTTASKGKRGRPRKQKTS